jgi:hypothetical protein
MGQEITQTSFSSEDEKVFHAKLKEETKILKRYFDQNAFNSGDSYCGLELEAWLVTEDFVPSPTSDQYIEKLAHPLVVPEISKFNFELNSDPVKVHGDVFSNLESSTLEVWKNCEEQAEQMDMKAVLIGTLPTLRDHMLTIDQLFPQKRYFALNKQIMKQRGEKPVVLEIENKDRLRVEHDDIITECAATSLQIHYGVTQESGPRFYNAGIIASSFMAAACANSPFLYGKELWDESRIAIFEQSVNLRSFRKGDGSFAKRVSLGNGYVKKSLLELFIENFDGHPILIPDHCDSDPMKLEHLRLHNGTVWRWNRPLIGFDQQGVPSLRIEFRVPSAGPSVADSIANMVFQIALVNYFAGIEDLESRLPFKDAEENFYQACRHGLDANIKWLDGASVNIQELLLDEVIPGCLEALKRMGISEEDSNRYLGDIIRPRIRKGQNGAFWQKGFVHTSGPRFQEMLELYYQFQKENRPVHLWDFQS